MISTCNFFGINEKADEYKNIQFDTDYMTFNPCILMPTYWSSNQWHWHYHRHPYVEIKTILLSEYREAGGL